MSKRLPDETYTAFDAETGKPLAHRPRTSEGLRRLRESFPDCPIKPTLTRQRKGHFSRRPGKGVEAHVDCEVDDG